MRIERVTTFVIIIVLAGGIFFLGLRFVLGVGSKNISSVNAQTLQQAYKEQIDQENDYNKLATDAEKLIKGNQLDCGIINLERAVELEPNFRDAWVLLGYAYLSKDEPQKAIESLKKAEEIDPTHADTFKYLADAYQKTGDEEQAKQAQERYDFLTQKK